MFGEFKIIPHICTRYHTKIAHRELAEWSNAVVLKTIVPRGTGGSNPSLSANAKHQIIRFDAFFMPF